MFWIGLIVGFIVGLIVMYFGLYLFTRWITGMTLDEMSECGCLIIEAGQNRESTIVAYHEDGELSRVTLQENE